MKSTKDYPDEVINFMRNHPTMYNVVYPVHKRPLVVRTNVDYEFTTIAVDQVTAADGSYEVLFLGTGWWWISVVISFIIQAIIKYSSSGLAVHHPLTLLLSSWITLNFLEQTADDRFALGFLRSGDGPESYCPAQRRLADRGAGVGGSGSFQGLTTSLPLIAPLKWCRWWK